MIEILNNGQDIASTNYWATPHAAAGYAFASWNAGALRLLLPPALLRDLPDMQAAPVAIVTRGRLQGRDAVEIMFDDNSEAPYALHVLAEQSDRLVPADQHGMPIIVTAWAASGMLHTWRGKYRVSKELPDLSPWVEH